jgi:manganese transport protein
VPMIALVIFTSRRDIMGAFVNSRLVSVAAIAGTATILVLNVILILQTFGVAIPGIPTAG